jgi:hypothetical protein
VTPLSASKKPCGQRIGAYEEIIALSYGPLGEPQMIHNRFWICTAGPQESGTGAEASTFTQGKGCLERSVTHVKETGVTKCGRIPAADDSGNAGIYLTLYTARLLTVEVNL